MTTHSSIHTWRIPWAQKNLVGYSPWGHKQLDMTKHICLAQQLKKSYSKILVQILTLYKNKNIELLVNHWTSSVWGNQTKAHSHLFLLFNLLPHDGIFSSRVIAAPVSFASFPISGAKSFQQFLIPSRREKRLVFYKLMSILNRTFI